MDRRRATGFPKPRMKLHNKSLSEVPMRKLICLFVIASALQAAVKLPAVISDHMVLQQGMPVRIWGTADPGEAVKVDFEGQSVSVTAGANGKWTAWLRPLV